MPREITREQAERKKVQAATFMERIGEPDRAEEFEAMSVDDYAERKGLRLSNPASRRRIIMASANTVTKTDLQDVIDEVIDVLEDAYEPESTREDLAEAVGQALDVLKGQDDDEEAEEDDSDEGDDLDDLWPPSRDGCGGKTVHSVTVRPQSTTLGCRDPTKHCAHERAGRHPHLRDS